MTGRLLLRTGVAVASAAILTAVPLLVTGMVNVMIGAIMGMYWTVKYHAPLEPGRDLGGGSVAGAAIVCSVGGTSMLVAVTRVAVLGWALGPLALAGVRRRWIILAALVLSYGAMAFVVADWSSSEQFSDGISDTVLTDIVTFLFLTFPFVAALSVLCGGVLSWIGLRIGPWRLRPKDQNMQ